MVNRVLSGIYGSCVTFSLARRRIIPKAKAFRKAIAFLMMLEEGEGDEGTSSVSPEGEPASPTGEASVESTEEQPVVEEEPAEAEPVGEQSTNNQIAGEQSANDQSAKKESTEQKPSKGNKCTVTFDGGGTDGEMEPVQVKRGKLYKLPECEYSIEGGVFDAWMVSSSDGSDPVAYQPGEAIKVTGDMTVTASWLFDDSAMEFGAGEIEYGGESDANAVANDNGTGLSVETEDASTGAEGLTLSGEPSEAGSVFNSAGIAAIIAAAVLVLVGAVIVIVKKKKK